MTLELNERWYLVSLTRGTFRIKAATADMARRQMTLDYRERVIGVELDEEQHDDPPEDY